MRGIGKPTLTLAIAALSICHAYGHGIVGERFFPATIATDDPFAADELALPTVTLLKHNEDGTPVDERDYEFEYSKSILPGFAISFADGYADTPGASGFDNFEITPVVQILRSDEHEFIASAGMSFEIGGSGSAAVADRSTTYTPEFLFGKGFGDLPDNMAWLRPLALTGRIAYAISGTSAESRVLQWGGAVEYSLLYLQNNVRDQGFSSFVTHLTPLIEFNLASPTREGGTTGTINPGILLSGQYEQIGIEAIVPVNQATASNVGVLMQLHFYLDDIFPHSLGRPLFGGAQ